MQSTTDTQLQKCCRKTLGNPIPRPGELQAPNNSLSGIPVTTSLPRQQMPGQHCLTTLQATRNLSPGATVPSGHDTAESLLLILLLPSPRNGPAADPCSPSLILTGSGEGLEQAVPGTQQHSTCRQGIPHSWERATPSSTPPSLRPQTVGAPARLELDLGFPKLWRTGILTGKAKRRCKADARHQIPGLALSAFGPGLVSQRRDLEIKQRVDFPAMLLSSQQPRFGF